MEMDAKTFAEAVASAVKAMNPEPKKVERIERPIGEEPTRVACIHPNGMTFTAVIVPSRAYPEGRVHHLEDEKYPPSYPWPEGYNPVREDNGQLKVTAKQRLYEELRRPLIAEVVGKPLPWTMRLDKQAQVATLNARMSAIQTETQTALAAPAPPEAPPPEKPKAPPAK